MEKETLIHEIQNVIENYGPLHCYENIVGSCLSIPSYAISKTHRQIQGIPYKNNNKEGYIQGFNMSSIVVCIYRNGDVYDSFHIKYKDLSTFYLNEVLKFLQRK
jgi:hypothetical protein